MCIRDRYNDMMKWLAGVYVNTLNVIHYMHDKYCYESIPVSYTHLDVYKRQVSDHHVGEVLLRDVRDGDFVDVLAAADDRAGVGGRLDLLELCLLYTSRCV